MKAVYYHEHGAPEALLGDEIAQDAIRLAKTGGAVAYMNNEPPEMAEIAERNIKAEFLHDRRRRLEYLQHTRRISHFFARSLWLGQEATPLMHGGTIYVSTAWSMAKAYDARTGALGLRFQRANYNRRY